MTVPPKVQNYRTIDPNKPPSWLDEGVFGVEMAEPCRLWVGVPLDLAESGKKMLAEAGAYVRKEGDTMFGPLLLFNPAGVPWIAIAKNRDLPGAAGIRGYNGDPSVDANCRWNMLLVDDSPETGSNAGSHFQIYRYDDAGVLIDAPFGIARYNGLVYVRRGLVLDWVSGAAIPIIGSTNGIARWQLMLGNAAAEIGANLGSDFEIQRFSDAGVKLDSPITIKRESGFVMLNMDPVAPLQAATKQYVDYVGSANGRYLVKTGDFMTGPLGISYDAPTLTFNSLLSAPSTIFSQKGTLNRWNITLGNSTPETGGNVGSDFGICRYDDAGTYMDVPLYIERSTGSVSVLHDPTLPLQVATKSYVDTHASALFVQKAGDVMTGALTLPGDPSLDLQAATKHYVDQVAAGGGGAYVLKTGDTMTGTLTAPGYATRSGTGGAYSGNQFNINWTTPGVAELWIDNVNLGNLVYGSMMNAYVAKAGDSMTGYLTLAADPSVAMHAATKQYVDTRAPVGAYVLKTGDTMSGGLTTTNLISTGELVAQAGVVRLNAPGSVYMHYDTLNINLVGAPVYMPGGFTANTFGRVNGSLVVDRGRIYLNDDGGGASVINFCDSTGAAKGEIGYDHSFNQFAMLHHPTNNSISFLGGGAGNFRYVSNTTFLCFDALPSGQFNLNSWTAVKTGGGVWASTSDARIKTVVGRYESGLNEVLQLDPVRYRYNGNYKDVDGENYDSPHKNAVDVELVGLVAQQAEVAMPEMVTKTLGLIDGKTVKDLRRIDATPLIYALVNCIKELHARIEALEAKT